MALTLKVIPGYIAEVGKPITVADLNQGFTPIITLEGSVGSADIQDGSIRINHLYSGFLAGAEAASAAASTDLLLLGTSAGTANRSVTVAKLLSGMWSSPLLYQQFSDWSADRVLFQMEDGEVRAIAPSGLASSVIKQAPLASALGDYAANLVGVNQSSGATAMKIADFAKALIAQAPTFASPEVLAIADEVLVHDASTGKTVKTTVGALVTALGALEERHSAELAVPATKGTETSFDHGLGATPRIVQGFLVYRGAASASGYAAGDTIPSNQLMGNYPSENKVPYLTISADGTKVRCRRMDSDSLCIMDKATGGEVQDAAIVLSDWRIRFYARR